MNTHLTVSEYLDSINVDLSDLSGRVLGEITEVQMYPDRSYLFFKIKDKNEQAVMTCFMWKQEYALSGVELEVGLEVIVSGVPEIFKPYGRFSFKTQTIEHVGEGKLKKAYDELKTRLEKEGVFASARKRPLPELPQKIGLITSKDGAAIGDFQVNLGSYGFKVSFIDSRVEGQLAAAELPDSIRSFRNKDIEVLVLVRGGGSLESLLPFNNETLVREIATFPVPVLVGVGHERDVPLVALAADTMVSTPTAAAQTLGESWKRAAHDLHLNQHKLLSLFARALQIRSTAIEEHFHGIQRHFQSILDDFRSAEGAFLRAAVSIHARIAELRRTVNQYPSALVRAMRNLITQSHDHVATALDAPIEKLGQSLANAKRGVTSLEKLLESHNPERQLRLGYSIVSSDGKIVRRVGHIRKGQSVDVRVQDGTFSSEVTDISKKV